MGEGPCLRMAHGQQAEEEGQGALHGCLLGYRRQQSKYTCALGLQVEFMGWTGVAWQPVLQALAAAGRKVQVVTELERALNDTWISSWDLSYDGLLRGLWGPRWRQGGAGGQLGGCHVMPRHATPPARAVCPVCTRELQHLRVISQTLQPPLLP